MLLCLENRNSHTDSLFKNSKIMKYYDKVALKNYFITSESKNEALYSILEN